MKEKSKKVWKYIRNLFEYWFSTIWFLYLFYLSHSDDIGYFRLGIAFMMWVVIICGRIGYLVLKQMIVKDSTLSMISFALSKSASINWKMDKELQELKEKVSQFESEIKV